MISSFSCASGSASNPSSSWASVISPGASAITGGGTSAATTGFLGGRPRLRPGFSKRASISRSKAFSASSAGFAVSTFAEASTLGKACSVFSSISMVLISSVVGLVAIAKGNSLSFVRTVVVTRILSTS